MNFNLISLRRHNKKISVERIQWLNLVSFEQRLSSVFIISYGFKQVPDGIVSTRNQQTQWLNLVSFEQRLSSVFIISYGFKQVPDGIVSTRNQQTQNITSRRSKKTFCFSFNYDFFVILGIQSGPYTIKTNFLQATLWYFVSFRLKDSRVV